MTNIEGPFGRAQKIEELDVAVLEKMYMERCGVSLNLRAIGVPTVELYKCVITGVRFWRPVEAAGDEEFYHALSAAWSTYYRDWRWEYAQALSLTSPRDRLLEIGCGRGYFLQHMEGKVAAAEGLELNNEAIANKVTRWPVHSRMVEDMAANNREAFDVVCSFQVLEHVIDPASFIEASLACLKPGGLLVYSTPNTEFGPNRRREDAFDLPPHHMSYFSHDSYRRIADLLGLKIVMIVDAPTFGALSNPNGAMSLKAKRIKITDAIRSTFDRLRGRTGMTTFVAMRKPAKSSGLCGNGGEWVR